MRIKNGFHDVHYEALRFEKMTGKESFGKGSTHKMYMFSNGYGASVINGFMSNGLPELAVLRFDQKIRVKRSCPKRLKKKLIKRAGYWELDYSTPVTSDVKRYIGEDELTRDLNRISKL